MQQTRLTDPYALGKAERYRLLLRPRSRQCKEDDACRTVSTKSATRSLSPAGCSRMRTCSTPSGMSACAIRPTPDAISCRARRSPQLLEPGDILEYTLDSEPVKAPSLPMFAERVIHGCLYAARPDVMAVCHHHAAAVLPFCVAGVPIEPVFHLGAATGETTPFWDQQDGVRRHQSPGADAGGRALARPCARQPLGVAAEPPWRDRRRGRHP